MHKKYQHGQILPSVLFLLIIVSILISLMILYFRYLNRFIITENRKTRNLYLARGACEQRLYEFNQTFMTGKVDTSTYMDTESGIPVSSTIRIWGFFPEITGRAGKGKYRREVSYRIGMQTPEFLNYALILTGKQPDLILADGAFIHGDVILHTIKHGFFKQYFQNQIPFNGQIVIPGTVEIPSIDLTIWHTFYEKLKHRIRFTPADQFKPFQEAQYKKSGNSSISHHVFKISSSQDLSDSIFIRGPALIYSDDDLYISGHIVLKNQVIIYCRKKIKLSGEGILKDVILIAPEGIEIEGQFEGFGQFYSERRIIINGNSHFTYPSVFLVNAENISNSDCFIEINERNIIEGLLLMKTNKNNIIQQFGQQHYLIRIGSLSMIRGVIYSDHQITLEGQVDGSVITNEFFYYASPTYYYNWIIGGHINRYKIKPQYLIPIVFNSEEYTFKKLFETVLK